MAKKKADVLGWVKAAVEGRVVRPYFLEAEAHERDEMNELYREVLDFIAEQIKGGAPMLVKRKGTGSGGVEVCPDCKTLAVYAVQVNVPGAFRVDACCLNCGKGEVHRAGWDPDGKARDEYRKRTRSLLTG